MKKLLFAFFASMLMFNAYSQMDIGNFFKAGGHDGEALMQEYLRPYGEMLGVGLNAGWYSSAKVHKKLGFDITITGAYIMAPSDAETYDVNNVNLESFELSGSTSIAPTIAGDVDDLPSLVYKDDPTASSFDLPNGTGYNYMVLPMVTVGIGLPYGIEVKGRFLPSINAGRDIENISLWGLGLQKDIKDYIPFLKKLPVLNVSLLAAYTGFSASANIEDMEYVVENGKMDLSSSGFTTRLLIGANLPVVSFYTGIGYGNSSSDFSIDGDFSANEYTGEEMDGMELDYQVNSFDFNAGMRIRLGILAIYGDYTFGNYSSFVAGLGFSFR